MSVALGGQPIAIDTVVDSTTGMPKSGALVLENVGANRIIYRIFSDGTKEEVLSSSQGDYESSTDSELLIAGIRKTGTIFKKWKVGDNTFTALQQFIKNNSSFKIDTEINKKSLISEAIQGYVKRIK